MNLLPRWIFLRAVCSAVGAAESWHVTSPIGFTVWRALWRWANEYLGDHDRATRWLKRPNRALSGLAPIAAIDTELGARQVENVLGRIAYGGVS